MSSHAENAAVFDQENPHVYQILIDLADRWQERREGEVCGIAMLYEVARWTIAMETRGDTYKLNNNWKAYYARKLMAEFPEFEGLFHTRQTKAESNGRT